MGRSQAPSAGCISVSSQGVTSQASRNNSVISKQVNTCQAWSQWQLFARLLFKYELHLLLKWQVFKYPVVSKFESNAWRLVRSFSGRPSWRLNSDRAEPWSLRRGHPQSDAGRKPSGGGAAPDVSPGYPERGLGPREGAGHL